MVDVSERYVPKEYHDPWKALRELQPTLKHPHAPSPEECMHAEEKIDKLMEVPNCAKLLTQEGVRASFFGAMVAKAHCHAQYYMQDERVCALFCYMEGWQMDSPRATPHPSLNKKGLADYSRY
ncbi:hypothetical protein AB1Y20_013326 [Prymnesium parvum]|uniref:Uncharacterized protein n=1 Tax=Prymnesium parvum TaxID=97485 RepID=A0AB34IKC7_PRYPA